MNEQLAPSVCEILVDGHPAYTGEDWRKKFEELSSNPDNGTITIFEDGYLIALVGPVTTRQLGGMQL